jgi:hypothetical protein
MRRRRSILGGSVEDRPRRAVQTVLGPVAPEALGPKYHPDSLLVELVQRMAEAGHAGSLLLGGDTGRRSHLRAHGGGPGMAHLFAVLVPRRRKALGGELVDRLVVANRARAFAFEPTSGP